MFSRSSKTKRRMVAKPATVKIIKPGQSEKKEEVLDLSKAKISIIKPDTGLRIMVEEDEGEDE